MTTKRTNKATNNGAANRISPEQFDGEQGDIIIRPVERKIIELRIKGTSPLLVHNWEEKAIKMIYDKQVGSAKKVREKKIPEEQFLGSRYVSSEGWDGVPAGGVKGCLVGACRAYDDLVMTQMRRFIWVLGDGVEERKPAWDGAISTGRDLVRIHGTAEPFESMVRIASGVADIRYRAIYREWSMLLRIGFIANKFTPDQVVNLVQMAGVVEGLCEHRPGSPKSNTGNFGTFEVVSN